MAGLLSTYVYMLHPDHPRAYQGLGITTTRCWWTPIILSALDGVFAAVGSILMLLLVASKALSRMPYEHATNSRRLGATQPQRLLSSSIHADMLARQLNWTTKRRA